MPYLDEWEDNYENSVSKGIGIGLGLNFFANNLKGGVYAGGMIEYWTTRFDHHNKDDGDWDWYADAAGIVFCANIGYRWVFSSGFFINLGGYFGAIATTKYEWQYKNSYYSSYSSSDWGGSTYFFGMLDLAFGFNFVK